MKINGKDIRFRQVVCLCLYYSVLRYLPSNTTPLLGRWNKRLRGRCCSKIFKKSGKNINIEKGAYFGSGVEIEIGNNSGLGVNCHIPSDTIIGDDVMMGPNCYILASNHNYANVTIPMNQQGASETKQTRIEDDVWIGRDVLMTPGRHISRGSIIAARCVLTKDFPEYSIVGGNPSKMIRSRLD